MAAVTRCNKGADPRAEHGFCGRCLDGGLAGVTLPLCGNYFNPRVRCGAVVEKYRRTYCASCSAAVNAKQEDREDGSKKVRCKNAADLQNPCTNTESSQ